MKSAVAAVVLAAAGLVPTAFGQEVTALSIGHICSAERVEQGRTGPWRLAIQDGIGSEGFRVRTSSAEAQRWFNYGVTLWHAFYHEDAKRAFDHAAAVDPDCGLCVWGQALSRGPTQNFDITPDQVKEATALAAKAEAAAKTPLETALAQAMVARYAAKQDPAAEVAFADALLKAGELDPAAQDLRLVAAEALLTAWRRGGHDGTAERAIALVQPILQREPNNVAAIHYLIHASEFAGHPELALDGARRLADLAPKASHLVHMASHTYLRLGYYEEAAAVNAKALDVDAVHAQETNLSGPLGAPDYYPHNLNMGLEGALMSGDGALAVKFADDGPIALPPGARPNNRTVISRGFVAYGRYAPDKALALPAQTGAYDTVMWRYARGEAFAAKGDLAGLRQETQALGAFVDGKPKLNAFEAPQARIARQVLQGRVAMMQGQPAEAARIFRAAADYQDSFHWGADPPPWWYPVRRSLAAAELKAGQNADAVKDANASLAAWPQDGLALQVLAQAQTALGHADESRRAADEERKVWRGKPEPLDLI
jgi:tetratricopeptide (TPR) repeat protein